MCACLSVPTDRTYKRLIFCIHLCECMLSDIAYSLERVDREMHLLPPPRIRASFVNILCCVAVLLEVSLVLGADSSGFKTESRDDLDHPSSRNGNRLANPRPNLVKIITDEQSFRTLSIHRDNLLRHVPKEKVDVWGEDIYVDTPNIDSIAKEGVIMTNFYTVAPKCTPSRASFYSGLYPHYTGSFANHEAMNSDVKTFANILQDNGYQTSFVGKWHLDGDEKPGWNTHKNGRDFGFTDNKYRFNRGHWKFFEEDKENGVIKAFAWDEADKIEGDLEKHYATDFLFDRGIEFIERAANNDEPFAIILSIPDPHSPNNSRPPYESMHTNKHFKLPQSAKQAYKRDPAGPVWLILDDIGQPESLDEMDAFLQQYEERKESKWQRAMQKYFGMVSLIDDNVGKLLDALKYLGIDDNTIVVFTSDHGDMLMEHGKFNKGKPYESSAGIPFLIRYPGKISPGKIVETPYSTVDFAPTMLSLMGLNSTDLNTHGVDGTVELLGKDLISSNETKIILSGDFKESYWAMAMSKGYKFIIHKHGVPWLFDLNLDPDEIVNYMTSTSHDTVKIQLQNALLEAIANGRIKWDLSFGTFLDMPSCLDSRDVMNLRNGRKQLCEDIGHTLNIDECEVSEEVKIHCPQTCGLCTDALDSEGLILLPSGEAKSCEALKYSSWCSNFEKARVFCPQACSLSVTQSPSAIPSSKRAPCSEAPSKYFFWKLTDKGFALKRKCSWLRERREDEIDEICANTMGKNSLKPARDVCKSTCDTCYLLHPSQAPSATPSLSPSPSSQPVSCSDDPSKFFFWKLTDKGFPLKRQCSWLRERSDNEIDEICANTMKKKLLKPAREVCEKTCSTCYLLHPSQAPSAKPSLSSSPSSQLLHPSQDPSVTPSISSSPSSQPTTSCSDNPSKFFFWKLTDKGFPLKRKCSWLRERSDNEIDEICANTMKKKLLKPAREVCEKTCRTCYLLHPSQAPSAKPSLSSSPSSQLLHPSQDPSVTPSISSSPSSQPTTSCSDAPSKYFFWKKTDKGFTLKRQCSWLRERSDNEIDEICANTIGKNLLKPAREVCQSTCGTC